MTTDTDLPNALIAPTETDDTPPQDEWVAIGRVSAPYGVHGEMRLELLTDFPRRFRRLKTVFVGDTHQPYSIRAVHSHPRGIVIGFAGIDTPEAAAALRKSYIWIPRSQVMPLPAHHYYHMDVIGLTVVTTADLIIGQVSDILQTGSNDVFVVQDGHREVLVPAIAAVVKSIDLAERRVVIEPIPGLLD